MQLIPYNRQAAVNYAHQWALARNPRYFDFSEYGGDCSSFVSQCLYAGSSIMNYSPVYGWYYISAGQRTASWSSVVYLHRFLTTNSSVGPYGLSMGPFTVHDAPPAPIGPGDIVQLCREDGTYYHSLLITDTTDGVRVTAHSFDAHNTPLVEYVCHSLRYIHILGVRNW